MGALDLTAGAYPVFMSENYLNRYAYAAGDLQASDGQDFVERLYDGVPEALFATTESGDGDSETITFGLYVEGAQVTRSIDFFAILNHNLLSFTVEFSDDNGATWLDAKKQTYSACADADTLYSFSAPFDCNKVKITMTHTQGGSPVNEQKQIGQIVVGLALYQMTRGMSSYEAEHDPQVKIAELADGSERYACLYRSASGFRFYEAKVGFLGCAQAERDEVRDIRDRASPFLFIPEPGDEPRDIFLCRMRVETYRDPYITLRRAAGHAITFTVREVGGS